MMAAATVPARNGVRPPPAAQAPQKSFGTLLDESREGLLCMIPDERQVDRIIRMVWEAWAGEPNIRNCDPMSVLKSVKKACELRLDPCGARKHCYLIPYKGECTLQISYMGMIELAHRSRAFRAIEARTVHEGDHFRLAYNPEPVFEHVPAGRTDDRSLTHAYAYARLRTGGLVIEVLTRDQVDAVRDRAQTRKVWDPFYVEMAKKTAIKKLLKRQPSSVELAEAIEHDNREYDLPAPAPAGVGATASARLANRLAPPEPEDASQETPHDPAEASQDDDTAPWESGRE